jgi:hypothetical protein
VGAKLSMGLDGYFPSAAQAPVIKEFNEIIRGKLITKQERKNLPFLIAVSFIWLVEAILY